MKIKETWINQTEGHGLGDSDWYEPYIQEKGKLFGRLKSEYGKCVSKIYYNHIVDPTGICGPIKQLSVGWVFEKKEKYTDTQEPYIKETWVEVAE